MPLPPLDHRSVRVFLKESRVYALETVLSILKMRPNHVEARRLRAAFTEVAWPGHIHIERL